jgi:hypothetical protein
VGGVKIMWKNLAKALNHILSYVANIDTVFIKKGGAYVVVEKLKLFTFTVHEEEHFIKDIIVDEDAK